MCTVIALSQAPAWKNLEVRGKSYPLWKKRALRRKPYAWGQEDFWRGLKEDHTSPILSAEVKSIAGIEQKGCGNFAFNNTFLA